MDDISKIRTLLDMARQALAYHINEAEQRHEKERLIRPDRDIVVRINAALEGPVADYERERDEARAEVERLKADPMPSFKMLRDVEREAYQRGAEAMREAAALLVVREVEGWMKLGLSDDIRALPIPEDK